MRLHLLLLYRSTKVCKSCASPARCTASKQAVYIQLFIVYLISDKPILSPLRLPVPPSRRISILSVLLRFPTALCPAASSAPTRLHTRSRSTPPVSDCLPPAIT